MGEQLKYKRILLKLSGEALLGKQEFGIDQSPLEMIANEVKEEKPISEDDSLIEDDETKNRWIWILASIFIFIVLILVAIFIIYPKVTEVPDVVIPNVAGMTVQKAEETLRSKGFEIATNVEKVSDEKISEGLVVKTSPAIGLKRKKGTEITLYESMGDTVYTIEDYTGRNYIEVKTILTTQYGLNVTIEKKDVEDGKEYNEEEIISQDVKVGTRVAKGSKITLYIPKIVDEYPNFVSEEWTLEEIKNFCDKYGVVVTFVPKQTDEYPENTIISQSRAAKTTIVKGATLKIVYAVKYNETATDTNTDNNKDDDNKDTNNN